MVKTIKMIGATTTKIVATIANTFEKLTAGSYVSQTMFIRLTSENKVRHK